MPFVRVRGGSIGDPAHEFDVSVEEFEVNSDLYELVDGDPVAESRPALIVPPVRAGKKPGDNKTAPAGADH